jgi:NarL family two-component system response regulator LiaR
MSTRIRVLLVDDHAMVRSGIGVLLETFFHLELVGQAATGQDGVDECIEKQPDVVLMDLMMPGMNGVEAIRQIRQHCPRSQIVVLTSFKDDQIVRDALQAGAIGYMLKNVTIDELVRSIEAAYHGKAMLAPEATQVLIETIRQPPPPGQNLTEREMEVLGWMAKGLSNPEIAEKLTISRATVKNHVSSILAKLGVSSRAEAIVLALQYKLVE